MKKILNPLHGYAYAVLRKCLILLMLLTAGLSAGAQTFEVGYLRYNVLSETDRTVEISGFIGEPTDLVIPETVKNNGVKYAVTNIGRDAFWECTSLASITIPNSVTSIGEDAFWGCTSLASVTIPNSVTSIGGGAFWICTSLASVTIPNSVINIGGCVFGGCTSLEEILVDAGNANYCSDNGILYNKNMTELIQCPGAKKEITIPTSVTSIGEYAFPGCSFLTSVTIPNSVTSIGRYAFDNCTSLASVTIPNSVTSIGEYAFNFCTSLASVTIPNSVTSIGGSAFNHCTSLASVTIPNSVTNIERYTFAGCTSLASVTIPNSVTSIDAEVFFECTSLSSVTIPNSVTSIGMAPFAGCTSLEEILVDAENVNYCSDNGILYNKDKTELIQCPGAKKEVTIPNSVTSIEDFAFEYCTSLASVIIPNSVTSIGEYAFSSCTSLASVSIPNSVTSIGDGAFWRCTSLASVTIPNSVKSIGAAAFADCTSLKTIYSEPTTPPQAEDAFLEVPEDAVIYVPEGTKEAYSQAEGWKYFTDIREMTSGVSELTVGNDAGPVDVYNMQGMLVKANASQADVDALAPGLYIIGGRKVFVK